MANKGKRYYNFSSSKQPTKGVAHSTPSGGGDMTKAVYDPTNVKGDAFDMDNMVDGTYVKTENNYSSLEAAKLSGIEPGAEVNNISDINATDLTDGGETTLHSHAGGGGLSQPQIMARISIGF